VAWPGRPGEGVNLETLVVFIDNPLKKNFLVLEHKMQLVIGNSLCNLLAVLLARELFKKTSKILEATNA